jgi:SAM-dependent methyltransferase
LNEAESIVCVDTAPPRVILHAMSHASSPSASVERVPCPLCRSTKDEPWAEENGFHCVRCHGCGLLFVNPRPRAESIDERVQLGVHSVESSALDVVGSRSAWKVPLFARVLLDMFPEFLRGGPPVRWLDVGAGFGELLESLRTVVPAGSTCEGIEPMIPKAEDCRRRGLAVRTCYLSDVRERFDVVSIIDVFSHVPDFGAFLGEIKGVLKPNGEVFIKTGNGADIGPRSRLPDSLTLPDHLVFGGQKHVRRFLDEAGFDIVSLRAVRMDGFRHSVRNLAKKLVGKPVCLGLPYTSPARVLYIRARLRSTS